jgi:hypothetical protein
MNAYDELPGCMERQSVRIPQYPAFIGISIYSSSQKAVDGHKSKRAFASPSTKNSEKVVDPELPFLMQTRNRKNLNVVGGHGLSSLRR